MVTHTYFGWIFQSPIFIKNKSQSYILVRQFVNIAMHCHVVESETLRKGRYFEGSDISDISATQVQDSVDYLESLGRTQTAAVHM